MADITRFELEARVAYTVKGRLRRAVPAVLEPPRSVLSTAGAVVYS
jgi:hypothetical protein